MARIVEAHLDAVAILQEAAGGGGRPRTEPPGECSRPRAPGVALTATATVDGGWRLDGVKPWCSLAGRLSHALVTAHGSGTSDGCSRCPCSSPESSSDAGAWHARGLRTSRPAR